MISARVEYDKRFSQHGIAAAKEKECTAETAEKTKSGMYFLARFQEPAGS